MGSQNVALTPSEMVNRRDKDAKYFADILRPYLNTREAVHAFEMYATAVRERAEAQTILKIIRDAGY